MAEAYAEPAGRIAEVPGLICKVWTETEAAGEADGVYLFADETSLEAYLGPKLERMAAAGIAGVRARKFDVNEPLTRITRGRISE